MPYIPESRRALITALGKEDAATVGELTYQLTATIRYYLARKKLSFQTVAEITAALHQCQRDFDERIVEPYEEAKREGNGDVWSPWEKYL